MNIDDLKKEAEECMHNALFWLKLPISKENVEQGGSYILKLLEPREKIIAEKDIKIAKLEQENAELKEAVSGTTLMYEHLTKAIELLDDVLLMAKVESLKGRYETVDEIENFLSSMRSFTEEEQKKYTESISKVYKKTGAKLFESEVKK